MTPSAERRTIPDFDYGGFREENIALIDQVFADPDLGLAKSIRTTLDLWVQTGLIYSGVTKDYFSTLMRKSATLLLPKNLMVLERCLKLSGSECDREVIPLSAPRLCAYNEMLLFLEEEIAFRLPNNSRYGNFYAQQHTLKLRNAMSKSLETGQFQPQTLTNDGIIYLCDPQHQPICQKIIEALIKSGQRTAHAKSFLFYPIRQDEGTYLGYWDSETRMAEIGLPLWLMHPSHIQAEGFATGLEELRHATQDGSLFSLFREIDASQNVWDGVSMALNGGLPSDLLDPERLRLILESESQRIRGYGESIIQTGHGIPPVVDHNIMGERVANDKAILEMVQ